MGWHFLANSHAIPLAAIGHTDHVDPGHNLEQLTGEVVRAPAGRIRHVDSPRVSLGVRDELWNGLGRNRRVHHHDIWKAHDGGNWLNVADEIEIELVIKCRIDCVHRGDPKKRLTIGGRTHDRLGRNIGARAWSIFNDELLAKPR
jgi:hypothetical protein